MKKCEFCQREYDEEIYTTCPFCTSNAYTEDSESEVQDNAQLQEDILDKKDDTDSACNAKDNAFSGGYSKTTNLLMRLVAVLAIIAVVFTSVFVYNRVWGDGSHRGNISAVFSSVSRYKTVSNPKTSNIAGRYADENMGIYYEFKEEKIEVDVPLTDEENSATAEDFIGSDGDSLTKKETFSGTFESGVTEDTVYMAVCAYYIQQNGLTDDFNAYISEVGSENASYKDYIIDRGLESDVAEFDTAMGLSEQYISMYLFEGYWRIESGELVLYNQNGVEAERYLVFNNALTNTMVAYKGKLPKKGDSYIVYTSASSEAGAYVKAIRMYDDGFCIFHIENPNEPEISYKAGSFEKDDDGINVWLDNEQVKFYVTDSCITPSMLIKE